MRPLAAIILAAGKGTRMRSKMPKVTFKIADKPMIQRVVDTALKLDCDTICTVVGFQKETVIAALEDCDRLKFVEQTEQLGTGHAVMITESVFANQDMDIMILCGDVPLLTENTLRKIYDTHINEKATCTVLTAFLDDAGKYGRIIRDESNRVRGIVEYKDASETQRQIQEFNTGIYCFNSLELFGALKETNNTNQQGEYYLTDALSVLYNQGKVVSSVILDDLMEVSGVNSQEQLAELEECFVDRIRKHWLNNGVVMHNPTSIYIGDEVIIKQDVEIDCHSIIKGKTILEEGSYIGPNSLIINSKIGQDTILQGYNVICSAYIQEHQIVPYRELIEEEDPYE